VPAGVLVSERAVVPAWALVLERAAVPVWALVLERAAVPAWALVLERARAQVSVPEQVWSTEVLSLQLEALPRCRWLYCWIRSR
jgi:hypothetical protein